MILVLTRGATYCVLVVIVFFLNFVCCFVCLFDLILYVHSTIFQLCGTVLPGFNQYLARINVSCSRTTTQ